MLREFLRWCYKNANDKRELRLNKREELSRRLHRVWTIDNELERGFCMLKQYVRYSDKWYNAVKSPEKEFWYIKDKEEILS